MMAVNMSVWENVESLEKYVWQTVHKRFYGRRHEWFETDGRALFRDVVGAGRASADDPEAIERLEHLKANGPSDHAFGWETCLRATLEDGEVRMSTITHNRFWRTLTLLRASISLRASPSRQHCSSGWHCTDMTKLIVDGTEIDVPPEYTLLQACEAAGAEIPRFCFHERLSIAGNCRMCLIEVVGGPPKPQASCAMAVQGPDAEQGRLAEGDPHQVADGEEGARRRDGVPADQPSARLPDLRSGRRVRPAGPGDGLRRRQHALSREQARGRRQVHRRAGQDDHEPLHPLHALCALRDRGRGRAGARRDRARRGHGDHDLSRKRDDLRAAGQRGRSLPGRRADLEAVCVRGAAVGAEQDRVDRRDGRARQRDPRRYARARGDAHPAARQRGRERGVDFRQDAPRGGRAAHAAARSALHPRGRAAASGVVAGGIRGDCREGEGREARPHRRDRGRSLRRSRRCSR